MLVGLLAPTTPPGTLVAGAEPVPNTITSPLPAAATWGAPYAHQLTATPGGATWSVADGQLPSGLVLDAGTGALSGTPTGVGPGTPFTIEASWPAGGDPAAFTDLAAGEAHTCAIVAADGSLDCWGDDTHGQATDRVGPFTDVAVGPSHTCAIVAADGSVDCWGDDTDGEATDQTGPYTAIAAGSGHTCGLLAADGSVDCWGDDADGQATDQTGPYTAVTAGSHHSCALRAGDGSADCWGDTTFLQGVDRAGPFTAIDAGGRGTCGMLAADGAVECWGTTPAGPTGTFDSVSVGSFHACAIASADGAVTCWTSRARPLGEADGQVGPFAAVSLGLDHSCGILATDGSVECWGVPAFDRPPDVVTDQQTMTIPVAAPAVTSTPPPAGTEGVPYHHQLTATSPGATWAVTSGTLPAGLTLDPATGVIAGTPTEDGDLGPITIEASWPDGFVDADAGARHTCGLAGGTGAVVCWGDDTAGQSADDPGPFTDVTAGDSHTCALVAADGSARCWGDDTYGQAPDRVGPYTEVVAGTFHTCGLRTSGAMDCWGGLGQGEGLEGLDTYRTLAAGYAHNCGILTARAGIDDAGIDCDGWALSGAAGDFPGPFTDVTATTQAELFSSTTCGLLIDGSVHCWGARSGGGYQRTRYPGPYSAIATGAAHTCGVLVGDGSTECWWGTNAYGESTSQPGPFAALTAGDQHTCGLLVAGGLQCWGRNDQGQTAVPTLPPVTDAQTFTLAIYPAISSISGTVTGPTSEPAQGVLVTAFAPDGFTVEGRDWTDANGDFAIDALPTGDYALRYWDLQARYATTWSGDAPTYRSADRITIAGATTVDQALAVRPPGKLGGRVTGDGTGAGIDGAVVQIYSVTDGFVSSARTNANGFWLVGSLPPGQYRIRYVDSAHVPEWHDDALTAVAATPLEVTDAYVRADAGLAASP